MAIITSAKESLSPDDLQKFYMVITDKRLTNVVKFTQMHTICRGQVMLQEMLLDLIEPTEAMELGLGVYQQHCTRKAMKSFYRKLKTHYQNQPSVHTRILKELQACLNEPGCKMEDVQALGQKLFKGCQHLYDELMTFIPEVPYPEGMAPSEEFVELNSDDEEEEQTFEEKATMPDNPNDELGGENCPCSCHVGPNTSHCIHCSLKVRSLLFLNFLINLNNTFLS